MSAQALPLWATIPATLLLVLGGIASLVGSLGLLRLRDFFSRMHGPSMTNTVGVGAILLASMLTTSALESRVSLHEALIALLILMSAPLASMMLVQAALYRNRARKRNDGAPDDRNRDPAGAG
jgi:multicomponent K+:H+ antiporter subunit G